jgi:hypothetical protein
MCVAMLTAYTVFLACGTTAARGISTLYRHKSDASVRGTLLVGYKSHTFLKQPHCSKHESRKQFP